MDGFVKVLRTAEKLLDDDPQQFLLAMKAAFRASFKGPNKGVGVIGHTDFKMSRKQFRGASKRLDQGTNGAIKTTNQGTTISLQGYDFADFSEHTVTNKRASKGPATPQKRATIEERLEDVRKEIYTPLPPAGVDPELWQEFLKTRHGPPKKKSLTERAMKPIYRLIDELVARGFSAETLVETAVSNGWAKIVDPEKDIHGNRKPAHRKTGAEVYTELTQGRNQPLVCGDDHHLPQLPTELRDGGRLDFASEEDPRQRYQLRPAHHD